MKTKKKKKKKEKKKKGPVWKERTVMETSQEHTAFHWKFSSLTGSNYFWDIKDYTGKEQVLRNRFL